MDELTKHFLKQNKDKIIFLIDSSAFCKFEEIQNVCGINLFLIMKNSSKYTFVMNNEVLMELIRGPRSLDLGFFMGHLINSEGAMDPKWKENRFLIEEDGETRYIILNKVSSVDYGQILFCQNHTEFILVTNDERMLKSASRIIPGRIYGPPRLIEELLKLDPINSNLKLIQSTAQQIYTFKHPFKK